MLAKPPSENLYFKPTPAVYSSSKRFFSAPAVKKTVTASEPETIDIDTDVSPQNMTAERDENTADMFADQAPHAQQQRRAAYPSAPKVPLGGYRAPTSAPSYTTGSNIPTQPAQAPQKTTTSSSAATTQPARAQRVQGSFIPPKPAVPGQTSAQEEQGQAVESQPTYSNTAVQRQEAPQAPAQQQTQTANTARPQAPVQRQQDAPKAKKAPSLFERLAESVRARTTRYEENSDDVEQTRVQPSLGDAQKTLGIDSDKEDNDLDIPAFLRRQAN